MMERLTLCILLQSALSLSMIGPLRAEGIEFPLVEDGEPVAQVLVGGDDPSLNGAVEDLKLYVARIAGATVEIKQGTEDLPGPTLHLGETELYSRLGDALSRVKVDGFAMARIGEDLLIAGNLPQGTANGIISVLQDQFGVKWYYPGPLWEIIPEKKSLAIRFDAAVTDGDLQATVVNPSYLGRTLWGSPPSEEFGRRMRLTQKGVKLPYVGTGHSLSGVVPPSKYFDQHPDYFALVDGKRSKDHPCFTHPDMFDIFMEHIRNGGTGFGVNDNVTVCRCDRCLAVDGDSEPYQGMTNVSESYCRLIARVAKQTAKEFPDRRIGIFAYQITNAPPKTVDHLGENVDVVLCQDTSQYFDPEYKRIDQEMSAEWVRKSGGVRMYDYFGINYWTPRYFPSILDDQLKHLAKVGVLGYGTHSSAMIDSSMPMFYLYYQLLWDVGQDASQLIDTMITDLYGEAAGPIRQFYQYWEDCWTRQTESKWFYGMDDFFGEMRIYTKSDIERGRGLLQEAASLAQDEKVKQRVGFLQDRYAFTYAAAQAYFAALRALHSQPRTPTGAMEMSDAVVEAWKEFVRVAKDKDKLRGTPPGGWWDKTFRVRMWGFKQMMRDAALAPVVRSVVAAEGEIRPELLRETETKYADEVTHNRAEIESLLTDDIGSEPRVARADGLRVADVESLHQLPKSASPDDIWLDLPIIDEASWVFELRPEDPEIGKYDEPIKRFVVDPPEPNDQSATWQAAWDDENLYLRVVVTDDRHIQSQRAWTMWKEDSIQVALNPDRRNFEYDMHSWLYIWGGYHGSEVEFGLAYRDGNTEKYVWRKPESLGTDAPTELIDAAVLRDGTQTVYEAAVDWDLLPDFKPEAEKSLGICIVVNDVDDGVHRCAEYGSGIIHEKRPTEFAAIRLVR